MSVRKEPSGRRWVQAEVEVPGSPEEVWQAIATGEGVSSWFVPTEVRDDGTVVSHFGPGMDAVATKTGWDPPRRFDAEGELAPNVKIATEWIVEARSGGTCVVRAVHSLFASTDDWDDQLENIEAGWPGYFAILRLYLEHFRGLSCTAFTLMAFTHEPASTVWETLAGGLGLSGAAMGERRTSRSDAPAFAGVVERTGDAGHPYGLLLRLDEPSPGIAHIFVVDMCGHVVVSIRVYLYGPNAPSVAASAEQEWKAWLTKKIP